MKPVFARDMIVTHLDKTAVVNGNYVYTVTLNGKEIGQVAFSDGHHSERGFSNDYGVDCYTLISIDSPLFFSLESAVRYLIEHR